ncbi:metal-dependent hydrolase [Candidatus Micrarchaeota archaeon]|nr:metal-dependent hydrolase [Candidatus Micrarchaeota archaeon]MBU1165844.1 metal-dependent hydrolase [Candidatus Micrarchaeota archaeon]MBU1887251.1 metal-dependent hydrolase [Candidatus Micrarchaeota archaeon]
MNWKSHALIGAILAFVLFYLLGSRDMLELIIIIFFGAISALVPDLDHDTSKGKKILDLVFISIVFFVLYFSQCGKSFCIPSLGAIGQLIIFFFAFLGVYFLFFRFFKPKHRGITHTLVSCFVFSVLIYLIAGWIMALASLTGYLSHLLADQHIKVI